MLPFKYAEWKISRENVLAYLMILCTMLEFGEVTGASAFTLSYSPCDDTAAGDNQTMTCRVNGNAITADGCLITTVLLELFETPTRTLASADYSNCDTNWNADNGRCVSKDPVTNESVYQFRLIGGKSKLSQKTIRCWSNCLSLSGAPVNLVTDYACCTNMTFEPDQKCLLAAGIVFICFGTVLLIVGVIAVFVTKRVFNDDPLGVFIIVVIAVGFVGFALVIISGILLTTLSCYGCQLESSHIIAIVFVCTGGCASGVKICIITVVCVKKSKSRQKCVCVCVSGPLSEQDRAAVQCSFCCINL